MTPPTSNPSSAMSQELSEEKLREHLSVKPKHWHAFKSLTDEEVHLAVSDLLATRAAILSLQRKNEELVRALTEIASFTQTDKLLWWQERAREALRSISEEK